MCVHVCKFKDLRKLCDDHYQIIKVVMFNNPDDKSLVELSTILQYSHPQDSFKCPDQRRSPYF